MMLVLEALFVLLVAADTILTYRLIALGKAVEIGVVARYYIENKAVAIILTVVATAFVIALLRFLGQWWIYPIALGPAYWRLGKLCRKHIRILNG